MRAVKRRESILNELKESNGTLKGIFLANKYGVTRQIIVKDIAILRAQGNLIIATPDGYIIGKMENRVRKVIAVTHNDDRLIDELKIIIKYGGIVEDVIVEHPIYGEIRGMLMIKNLYDLENFMSNYRLNKIKLLSLLTDGVHIHTITAQTQEDMQSILRDLNDQGFIIE